MLRSRAHRRVGTALPRVTWRLSTRHSVSPSRRVVIQNIETVSTSSGRASVKKFHRADEYISVWLPQPSVKPCEGPRNFSSAETVFAASKSLSEGRDERQVCMAL